MMTGQWSNCELKFGNGKCIKFEITGMDMKVSFTVKSITCLSYNLFPEWLPPCNPEDPLCHVQPGVHPHLHLTVSGFHWVSESHRNEISDHRVFWHLFPDPRCKISFLNRVPHNPKKKKTTQLVVCMSWTRRSLWKKLFRQTVSCYWHNGGAKGAQFFWQSKIWVERDHKAAKYKEVGVSEYREASWLF